MLLCRTLSFIHSVSLSDSGVWEETCNKGEELLEEMRSESISKGNCCTPVSSMWLNQSCRSIMIHATSKDPSVTKVPVSNLLLLCLFSRHKTIVPVTMLPLYIPQTGSMRNKTALSVWPTGRILNLETSQILPSGPTAYCLPPRSVSLRGISGTTPPSHLVCLAPSNMQL